MIKKYPINFEAYFLGPKGENAKFYENLLIELFNDHISWRKAFHSTESKDFITQQDKKRNDFQHAQKRIKENLFRLNELLKKNQPFFSPRYIGHMNWEIMAAPLLAYFSAALYNPNNVAKAGSTGTSKLELEVGKDFIQLIGFEKDKAWGHICAGGTIANIEALWIARNLKYFPLALKKLLQYLKRENISIKLDNKEINISRLDDLELLRSFNPTDILDMKEQIIKELKEKTNNKQRKKIDDLFVKFSFQGLGFNLEYSNLDSGLVFLPQTKHYSLKKAMDILGLGHSRIRYVPVNEEFRMDIDELEKMLIHESRKHPILAVVGVLGTTEEGSVDEVDRIVRLREKLKEEKGIGFFLHVDAAYGGYARTLFLDEENQFMDKEKLDNHLRKFGIIGDKPERQYASWPSKRLFDAFKALSRVDSVSIDPHKLGYVLYPAGGIVFKDKRMRGAIETFAPYVFPKPSPEEPDDLIGAYILEGSKPGAAAAAVWLAHRIMPLNIRGYGRLIGETIDGAQALWFTLQKAKPFPLKDGIQIEVIPIQKPDLNIVNYVFNFTNNHNLEILNRLTKWVFDNILAPLPDRGDVILEKTFIVSSTSFDNHEYANAPLLFLKKIGIPSSEWERVGKLEVLRSVIMSPYLTPDFVDENYAEKFLSYLQIEFQKKSSSIIQIIESQNNL